MAEYINVNSFELTASKDTIWAAFGLKPEEGNRIPCMDRPIINQEYTIILDTPQKQVTMKDRQSGSATPVTVSYLHCKDAAGREHYFVLRDLLRAFPNVSRISGNSEEMVATRTAETERLQKPFNDWLNTQNLHALGAELKETLYRLVSCESFKVTALRFYRNQRIYSVTVVPRTVKAAE